MVNNIDMDWYHDDEISSSYSSSSSSAAAAAAATIVENPQRSFHGISSSYSSSSSAAAATIVENPQRSFHGISSSYSSSSSAAAAAATIVENPQRSLNGTSSSSATANPLILDNPRRSNTMGAPPLPLHGCEIGHRPKRVLWTQKEIDKTRDLYKHLIRQLPPELKRRIASVIWDYIVNKMDPDEVARIYHPCHITDSQKIRHCIRLYITPFL
jgi:hypothetical protein